MISDTQKNSLLAVMFSMDFKSKIPKSSLSMILTDFSIKFYKTYTFFFNHCQKPKHCK